MNKIQIYYSYSSNYKTAAALQKLLLLLPNNLMDRAMRYRKKEDAFNFVLGRLLLERAIKTSGLDLGLEDLYFNKESKPLLNGLYFSIAHSQNVVACAFGLPGAIGLDIEFRREINPLYFKHCFSAEEWGQITKDSSLDTFYSYWTQKEAILKANGLGLNRLLDIEIISPNRALFYENKKEIKQYLQNSFLQEEGLYSSVCSLEECSSIVVEELFF